MTKKQKQKKQKSVILKTFGELKRGLAEKAIANKAIKRKGGRVQRIPGKRRV